jgi:hypothetical protein
MQAAEKGQTMNIKIKMRGPDEEGLLEKLQEFLSGADTMQEFNKRMNELENKYTLKRDFLQTSKRLFYTVLDDYIQGILTKEKALLLLQSYHRQMDDEIADSAAVGSFIEIDYGDGRGYMPEEYMKIVDKVNYYYSITKNNIENAEGTADIKLENFSSSAVKRVVKSVSASFDKYFGTAEKENKESQKQETTSPMQSSKPSAPESYADSLPSNKKTGNKTTEEKKSTENVWTEYDEELLGHGYIDKNYNAINSAPDIAAFLFDEMRMENIKPKIIMRYKYKGKPFTKYTANKAVTYARSKDR